MHELAIAQGIVDIAVEASGGARVTRVVLEVGALTAVMPEALQFCFELASRDTVAEGARLDIVDRPARARCGSCGGERTLAWAGDGCPCGGMDVEWLSGQELKVREMEVA